MHQVPHKSKVLLELALHMSLPKIVCPSHRGWGEAGERRGNFGKRIWFCGASMERFAHQGYLSPLNMKLQLQFEFRKAEGIKRSTCVYQITTETIVHTHIIVKMNITSHFQKFRGDSELIEKTRPLTVSIPTEIQTGQAYLQVDTLIQDPRKYPVKFPREKGI